MLISFDEHSGDTKKATVHNLLKARVTHLEGLLSANLDTLNNQQKYYEGELQKWQGHAKRMQ